MSKLPVRKNVEPLFKIVSDLDKSEIHSKPKRKTRKDVKSYSANFRNERSKSADGLLQDGPKIEDRLRADLKSKDVQIEKLIEKITILFESNNQFAVENEKLHDNLQKAFNKIQELESINSCENCDTLLKESQELRNDLKMMKILVYRLNVQIERYQENVKETKPPEKAAYKDNLNWGSVNTHTLGPLLNAYEEIIEEKNDLIENFEHEMHNFTIKMKKVVEENEMLHKEVDSVKVSCSVWEEEKVRLQAQIDVFRQKAEIQTKRADMAKEKLTEVLKCYEQKSIFE